MKKIILLLVLALLLCAIYGCAKDDSDELYFHLESLPDIGDYTPDVEPKRWYDDYTGELIPRGDYGPLRPYCGNIVNFDSAFVGGTQMMLYGLCTEGGTVVTDPVYTSIAQQGDWFILRSKEFKREGSDDFNSEYSFCLARTDGSVCTPIADGASWVNFLWDDLISVTFSDKVQLLDYDGNVVTEFESSYLRVDGDYLIVTEYSMSDNYQHISLLDRSLDVIATSYYSLDLIGNKFYYTYDENDTTRIFNMQGEELFTDLRIKNFTSYIDGIFLVADNKNSYIYDYDMNLLSSLSFSRISGIGLLGKKILRVNINNNPATYMDFEGNTLDYNDITILTDHYVMSRNATTYIVDADLNIVAEIDGKYAGMAEDTEAGIIYLTTTGTSSPMTSAYSLEKKSFVAENVHKLYTTNGLYYRLSYETAFLAYDCEIYRAQNGELVYSGKEMPSHLELGDKIYHFAQVGDYAVTYDEDFNELTRVRINKD